MEHNVVGKESTGLFRSLNGEKSKHLGSFWPLLECLKKSGGWIRWDGIGHVLPTLVVLHPVFRSRKMQAQWINTDSFDLHPDLFWPSVRPTKVHPLYIWTVLRQHGCWSGRETPSCLPVGRYQGRLYIWFRWLYNNKIQDYLGIFPNMGRVFSIPKTSVILNIALNKSLNHFKFMQKFPTWPKNWNSQGWGGVLHLGKIS